MSKTPLATTSAGKTSDAVSLVVAALGALGAYSSILETNVNIWLKIGLVVLVAIIGFVLARVTNLANWLAGKIDTQLQNWFTYRHYQKKYLEHITFRHRNLDVKGLTTRGIHALGLNDVFVNLSIAPRSAHQTTKNPIELPPALTTGRHAIWDYLQANAVQDFVIIGAPGSGKTTLLKHIALYMANPEKKARERKIPDKLPILLFLRDHAEPIGKESDDNPYTMEEAVQRTLRKWEVDAPEGFFKSQLDKGQCIVMLDGLDEVADAKVRQTVVTWVERQIGIFHKNQFIVTSRPFGYSSNPLSGVTVLEVRSFDSQQQQQFIKNWYLANEIQSQGKDDRGVRMDAQEGAEDLWQRLRGTPKLADLAVNPLLLTMITTVHCYRGSLPGRRVELYAEICDVFLGKRQQSKGLPLDLTPAQRQRVLQPLAWYMMEQEVREVAAEKARFVIRPHLFVVSPDIKPDQFLRQIENESGLVLEKENDEYQFAHLTFQEYLAAEHARAQQLGDALVAKVTLSWWRETILLYAAKADATAIVQACLPQGSKPDVEALLLAAACVEEAQELDYSIRQQVQTVVDVALDEVGPEMRKLLAEFKLRRRLQSLVRVSETKAVDMELISQAEYQLFLDEMCEQYEYYYPDHWLNITYPEGQGSLPILGVRSTDAKAFCQWLTNRIGDGYYRLPEKDETRAKEINFLGMVTFVGYWVTTVGKEASLTIINDDSSVMTAKILASVRNLALALDLNRTSVSVLVRDLTINLASARTLASDLVSTRSFATTNVRDHARNLANALANALASALASAKALDQSPDPNLANALARALASARSNARDLAKIHTTSLVSTHTSGRASDLNSALASALVRARDLALGLASASTLAHDRDLARVFDLDPSRASLFTNAKTLDLTSALAKSHSRMLASAKTLDLTNELVRARDLGIARALARDLARNQNLARDLAKALEHSHSIQDQTDMKWRLLVVALGLRLVFLDRKLLLLIQSNLEELIQKAKRADRSKLQESLSSLDSYLQTNTEMYATYAILYGRMKGKIEPFEGIRIVREVQDDVE